MNKITKQVVKALEDRIGEWYAGYIISHLVDCLSDWAKDGDRDLRKITFVFNDYFDYPLDLTEVDDYGN